MAPPDDYGWAYIDAQRATASADGPSGSLQFRWGSEDLIPGQFSGSEDLVFYANSVGHLAWDGNNHGTGSQLYLYGDLFVTGAIYADSYTVRSITTTEVEVSGSTTFGDSSGDTHRRTGSLEVSNTAVFSANVQAAEYIYHQGDLDTYIRFQTDDIDIQAGGVDFIKITEDGSQDLVRINPANADVDFIVSTSQSSGSLKIDGATGDIHLGGDQMVFDHSAGELRIRPGTTKQGVIKLHSRDGDAADEAQLQFMRYTDGTFGLGDNLGIIQWKGAEDEDGTYYTAASIVGEVDEAAWTDGSSNAGRLLFYTTADGATVGSKRMQIGSDGTVEITGSLEVSAPSIFSDTVYISNMLAHKGDGEDAHSDTYMGFWDDAIQLRAGSTNMIYIYGSDSSGSQNYIGLNSSAGTNDTDFYMKDGTGAGTYQFYVRGNDSYVATPGSMHISAALGPITGSGEIHAATFVGNDVYVSGTIGIGTASPDVSLDVKASAHGDGIQIEDDGTTTKVIKLKADSGGGSIELRHIDGDQKVRLDSNGNSWIDGGNVGIGTQSPSTELDVDGDTTVSGELLVGGIISHIGDSDTKMLFGTDEWELRNGNVKLITTVPTNVTINSGKGDVDFIVDGDTNDKIFHIQAAAEGSGPAEMVHISGTLGPLTSSGEIHAQRLVSSDARISGSIRVGHTGIAGGISALITNSGSSHALSIVGGMSASHDVSVQHLYTNDLYISGTAYGITVDRANYASASDTGTNRVYSPSGFETSGYLYVSGSSILGSSASCNVQVTGNLEASGYVQVSGELETATGIRHLGDEDTKIYFGTDTVGLFAGGVKFATLTEDDNQDVLLINENRADVDFRVSGDSTPAVFHVQAAAEGSGPAEMVHISGTLGPVSGSGEIHAAKLVANAMALSGTLSSVGRLDGSNNVISPAGTFTLSGSSHAVQIAGGLSASHDVKVEHLYTNDLYVSGSTTLSALTVPGALTATGGAVFGNNSEDTHQVTGSLEVSGPAHFTSEVHAESALNVDGLLTVAAGAAGPRTVLGAFAADTHQVTGSFEVSGPANFTSVVNAEAALNVAHLLTANLGVSTTGSLEASGASFLAGAATVGGLLTVNDSTVIGTNSAYAHQFTGSTHMAHSLDVTGAVGVVGTLTTYSDFRATDDTQIGSSNTNTHQVSGSVWMSEGLYVTGTLHTVSDLDVRGHSTFGRAAGYDHKFTGSVHVSSKLNVTGALTAVGDITTNGNLDIHEGQLRMPDNTSAKILVADGTSYQEVAVSNHITIASNGAVTIANDAVDTNQIADDAIEAAQIADGAIGNVAVDDASLRADKLDISNSTDIGEAIADDDVMVIANTSGNANRKSAMSRVKTYTKTDVSALGTAEASKAVVLDSNKDIGTLGGVLMTALGVTGSISALGSMSGSNSLAIQGSASFGAPVDISGDLVFHAAATAGRIDIKVNDGAGADTAIQIGKNGIVTKIGDDTPSDGQYLSWDNTAGKVAWADGLTSWGMSGSDNHYSSTELRTSGDLKVSGSITFGAGTGLSGSAAGPGSYLVLDANNQVKMSAGSADYTSDNAEIVFGSDSEVKLVHDPDAGLIVTRTATADNNPVTLTLKSGEEAISATDVIGKIEWKSSDDSGSDAALALAEIQAMATATHNATVNSTALIFKTATDGAPVKHLELDATGELKGYSNNSEAWSVTAAGTGSFQQIAIADRIIHTGDTDTGIFFTNDTLRLHAANQSQAQITINGTEVVINEESNSLDFRVESNGEANMFFVDGGANKVSIAAGYGSTGLSVGTTGSVQTNGHIQADGGFFTVGNIESAADIFADNITITGVLTATSGTPSFDTMAVADKIMHTGDVNTSIDFTTDQIDFVCGGTTMMTLDETSVNAVHFFAGSGSGGGTIYESGNLKVDGDLYLGGGDIRNPVGNTVVSFGTDDNIDYLADITADVTIHTTGASQLKLVSDAGQSSVDFYGRGDSMSSGDNVGALRFYGTEDDGEGNSALTAMMIVETAEAAWNDGSSLATKMRFQVGRDADTALFDGLTIDGSVANTAYPFVGIGTTAPDAKLHIVDPIARGEGSLRVSNTDTGMAVADTIVNLRSADSTFTSSNYWIKFYDSTTGATVGTVNSEVAYSTFTGQHPTPLPSGSALQEGAIIASTGQLAFDGGLSNAWVSTRVTTAAKDKAVVGIYRGFNIPAEDSYMGEDQHVYNAIGEGQVLVTDQNGDIETGDYICSSDRAGHGMLQDDDLLHNYTVAKATTPIDFSTVDVDSELGFKSVLVPCTYHCG